MSTGHHPPRAFTFGSRAVCARPFTHDGRCFKAGDEFPYEAMKLERYQVHGLWLAHLLHFEAAAVIPSKSKRARTTQPAE